MTRVAAAPNHTVVLCAASCPPLPHGASFSSVDPLSGAHVDGDHALTEIAEEGTEGDMDSDCDEEEGKGDTDPKNSGRDGPFSQNADRGFEPLTLKQLCEAKLAQEVDLHNAGAVLAYAVGRLSWKNDAQARLFMWYLRHPSKQRQCSLACCAAVEICISISRHIRDTWPSLFFQDALDAPALVRFCAEFVRWNLDGILVMGRESDRSCLLEASASGVVS